MMRRVLTAVLLVAAFAAGASAQQATRGTMTTAGQVVQLDTRGASTASIAVSGTWSGTVNFEVVAGGGTDPVTVDCATPAAPGTAVNNTTSGGVWVCPVAGMLAVQARLSDAPTGTVVVDIVSSPAPGQTVAAAGGGGGGNDAASATGSSVPASASYNAVNVGGTLRGQTGTSVGSHYAGAVQIMDGSGNAITSFGGGTQYTQDAALTVSTTVGTMAIGRASEAVPSDVSADGDAVIPWYLRSGAQAMQVTFGGVLATAGNGASGTGVQRVTLASDSTGNVATIGTSVTPGTSAAHLGKAEDAAAGNGDTGVAVWGVAQATPSATAADGDYIALKTDANGRQWVNAINAGTFAVQESGGALTALQLIDNPVGSSTGGSAGTSSALAGGIYNSTPPTLTNGQQAGLQLTSSGALIVSGAGGTTVQYLEDAAHSSGDQTVFVGAIRRDTTPTSSSGAAGDYSAINVDANGRLYTQAVLYNSSGTELSLAGDKAEDSAHSDGDSGPPILSVRRDTAATSAGSAGDYATVNTDSLGRLWTRRGDPCADHARVSVAVIDTSTSGNVEVVALNGSDLIYVCGYSVVVGATGTSVQFVYGTGTACATGETNLTGAWPFAANGGITQANAGVPQFVVPAGNALCVELSAANPIAGHVTYVRTAAP